MGGSAKHVQYRQEINVNHTLFIEIHMKKKFSSSENALKIKAHFSLAPPVSIWIYTLRKKGMTLGLSRNENNTRFPWLHGEFNKRINHSSGKQ